MYWKEYPVHTETLQGITEIENAFTVLGGSKT